MERDEIAKLSNLFRLSKTETEAFYKSAEAKDLPFDADVALTRKLLNAYDKGDVAKLLSYHLVQVRSSDVVKRISQNRDLLHALGLELLRGLRREYKRADWLALRKKLTQAEEEIYGGSTGW